MANTIDQSFIKNFEAEVHLAYQQTGTKLRSTVRVKNDVIGSATVFQSVGQGTASTKERNGLIPVMNATHTPVECDLQDYYAGDWVDKLDELKTNIDERAVIASAGAYALGRKTDELIITELSKSTQEVVENSEGLTKGKIMKAIETLNANNVPDDGQRYAVVGVHQWTELLNMPEFTSADYVGDNYPLVNGAEARKWMGVIWILHTDLPLSTTTRECFIYHKNAIGHAIGQDVKTDISWQGERAANFVSNCMSQGSVLIDAKGVVKVSCDDTTSV
ncbi:MAG: phage capsid protein [Alphaproteobacteria bacterium]|jgi:hypothetical protein|nr:phage capsid protein [Alphaproteobacteria bacterium]